MNQRRCTCVIKHVQAAAATVIFQLLVDFVPKLFLQKMIRNDVLSDRKVLQRFIDVGKLMLTNPFVTLGPFKEWWGGGVLGKVVSGSGEGVVREMRWTVEWWGLLGRVLVMGSGEEE